MVYRDYRGVEYDPVKLPTHEVTDAVAIDARQVSRSMARKPLPLYTGVEGKELAEQPKAHRRRWTDQQWLAYEEYQQCETERETDEVPVAAVWVVRSHGSRSE